MSEIAKENLPRTGDDSKMLFDKYRWYLANWITDGEAEKNRGRSPMAYDEWLKNNGVEPKRQPKTIRLERVRYGETFAVNGWRFTVLDHIAGGVLCLDCPGKRGPFWAHEPFDNDGCNDLNDANIGDALDDYATHLKEEHGMEDAILPMFVNLKDTASVRNYGLYECDAGLLTLDEYGKYKRLIPVIDEPWWLATPYKAVGDGEPTGTWGASAWYVDTAGNIRDGLCDKKLVVRPTVTLKPDTIVTLVSETEYDQTEDAELDDRERLWESYMNYLDFWKKSNAGIEHYGKDPMCFEEWKDLVEAGDRYAEPDTSDSGGERDVWLNGYLEYVANWAVAATENGTHGESPLSYEEWLKSGLKKALSSSEASDKTGE